MRASTVVRGKPRAPRQACRYAWRAGIAGPRTMIVTDPPLSPAFGVFHRGDRRTIVRSAMIDPANRPAASWPEALAALRDTGATAARVVVPWTRHARGPGNQCLDGSDGRTPDATGVARAAVAAGLDLWVAAGPIAGGVPPWAGSPGAFRAEARRWAVTVAAAMANATGGRVAIWEVDGAPPEPASAGAPWPVEDFRRWLRDRHGDDVTLAREWLRPGLRIDDATPPEVARRATAARRLAWRLATWVRSLLGRDAHQGRGSDRRQFHLESRASRVHWGTNARDGSGAMAGSSPGQLADWHAFTVDAWHEHLVALREAVAPVLPGASFVASERSRAGVAGVGHAGAAGREAPELVPYPVARVGLSGYVRSGRGDAATPSQKLPRRDGRGESARSAIHDAAWGAASLVARSGGERPVIVAFERGAGPDLPTQKASRPGGGPGAPSTLAGAIVAAIGEGAIAYDVPEASFADPDVGRLAAWVGEVEEELTASTRLDDPVGWLDEPSHAGIDPDDRDAGGGPDRAAARAAFVEVREAGLAPVVVNPAAFVPDEPGDLVALLAPTRRWIDLDRYGSLVVHVLRGGNLVAFPFAPGRQRDGTPIRTTFLWPPSLAPGGRAQVRDGTSTLVPDPARGGNPGPAPGWIGSMLDGAATRFRPAPGLRVTITARLLPGGDCLAFVTNPLDRVQSGAIGIPDPAAVGAWDGDLVAAEYATVGASAWSDGTGIGVTLPAGGAVVARLPGPRPT